jgi:hypothetical protein
LHGVAETAEGSSVHVRELCGRLTIDVDEVQVFKKSNIPVFEGYESLVELTSEWFEWPNNKMNIQ